jgi:hypothetical protein
MIIMALIVTILMIVLLLGLFVEEKNGKEELVWNEG